LPIGLFVSSPVIELEKLLAVPKLTSGARAAMVNVQIILEWTLEKHVEALCEVAVFIVLIFSRTWVKAHELAMLL